MAEVTSTPWGERHAYVLEHIGEGCVLTKSFAKALHVSPFMGMEQRYTLRAATHLARRWQFTSRATSVRQLVFDATLALRRAPLSRRGWLASPRATRQRRCACSR